MVLKVNDINNWEEKCRSHKHLVDIFTRILFHLHKHAYTQYTYTSFTCTWDQNHTNAATETIHTTYIHIYVHIHTYGAITAITYTHTPNTPHVDTMYGHQFILTVVLNVFSIYVDDTNCLGRPARPGFALPCASLPPPPAARKPIPSSLFLPDGKTRRFRLLAWSSTGARRGECTRQQSGEPWPIEFRLIKKKKVVI